MWCDDFDADLLAVVPGAAEALGPAGDTPMWTYSRPTDGKINCPAAWNTDDGYTALFWTAPEHQPGPFYATRDPVVACTFLEAVRDEWVHSCAVAVNYHVTWRPPVRLMERLMFDLRGWTALEPGEREDIQERVRRSLRRAAGRLGAVLATAPLAT